MKRKRYILIFIFLITMLLISAYSNAQDEFQLTTWTISSSRGQFAGDVYHVQAEAGQPSTGMIEGGDFSLTGGFVNGVEVALPYRQYLYLPVAIK
jgi:hypothetical protein